MMTEKVCRLVVTKAGPLYRIIAQAPPSLVCADIGLPKAGLMRCNFQHLHSQDSGMLWGALHCIWSEYRTTLNFSLCVCVFFSPQEVQKVLSGTTKLQ
jgi:hypothetical protein